MYFFNVSQQAARSCQLILQETTLPGASELLLTLLVITKTVFAFPADMVRQLLGAIEHRTTNFCERASDLPQFAAYRQV